VHDVASHLVRYSRPELQRYIIRILLMVPIYAVESWFALRYKAQALYLESLREWYEALAIYSFYKLMERSLGASAGEMQRVLRLRGPDTYVKHLFPFCCLPQWKLSSEFIRHCRFGVFQYVVLKVIITLLTLIFVVTDTYGEGDLGNFKEGYVYMTFLNNVSQIWAMYCLILFYHTLKEELAPLRPLQKLLCIKAVVFMTFWQGMLISILSFSGIITSTLSYTQDDVAHGLQNFLVCIEMLFAAIAHRLYFSAQEFDMGEKRSLKSAAMDIMPVDLFRDAMTHLAPTARSSRHRGSLNSSDEDTAGVVLVEDVEGGVAPASGVVAGSSGADPGSHQPYLPPDVLPHSKLPE